MREPPDAAFARTTSRNQHLDIADQRVDRWFFRFRDLPPTGYLDDVPSEPE